MLTQYHYRFLKLAEEATEIAHRVAKLMQFGPGEREPGQIYTNAERVRLEMMDLMTCYSELVHRGDLTEITDVQFEEHETVKLAKMEKFLKLSIDLGEVEPDTKVNAIRAVIDTLPETGRTVPKLISTIDGLFSDQANGVVTLCTIHKAKGLEFKTVYILEPALSPSKYARQEWMKRQEVNLQYVAATRAQERTIYVDSFSRGGA